jgi:arylsulfatase A
MPIRSVSRRGFLTSAAAGSLASRTLQGQTLPSAPPNIIVLVADDLGFGDLHCYGSKVPTPNLDAMAQQGIQLTQYYAASPVCSPSRAALLTGRYAPRTGVPDVLQINSRTGLLASETTIAQMVKGSGYSTMCVGKWHVGSLPEFMPNIRGFDQYFGLPNSVDMDPLALVQNTTVIESRTNASTLTQRYTQQAVNFISNAQNKPFFLYLAHSFPHHPAVVSPAFKGATGMGRYADAIAEIDWSVGQVLQALRDNNVDSNTLVVFSSDHGPWYQGSPGTLRGRKGETFEGGMRVPFIARFPGYIPAGQVNSSGVATALDLLPTIAALSGAPLPGNTLDGVNIWPMLSGQQDSVQRDAFLYIDSVYIQAARVGPWKLHVSRQNTPPWVPVPDSGRWNLPLKNPELYNLRNDPEESFNVASENPQIVSDILARIGNLLPGMPSEVQNAWRMTMNTPVCDTPDGAWPVKFNS